MVSGAVSVSNHPTDFPDADVLDALNSVLAELENKLDEGGVVSLSATSLAALESITAVISGSVSVDNHPSDFPDATSQSYLSNRYGGGKLAFAGTLNTEDDHVIVTPTSGSSIKVYWVSFVPDPDNNTNPLVTVKFQSGTAFYTGYAMAHWEIFTGSVDDPLVVSVTGSGTVAVTVHYEEVP